MALLLESVRQMDRMLQSALDGDRAEETPMEARPGGTAPALPAADMAAWAADLCRRCLPYARDRGIRLTWRGDAPLAMRLDGDALSRILLNLLANALRFTPRGGSVAVTWRSRGDFAELTVTDTGRGIPPDRLEAIFLPGVTDGGHGHGLPSARRLARAMGGDISVASRPGQGSAFTLRLPVAPVGNAPRDQDS